MVISCRVNNVPPDEVFDEIKLNPEVMKSFLNVEDNAIGGMQLSNLTSDTIRVDSVKIDGPGFSYDGEIPKSIVPGNSITANIRLDYNAFQGRDTTYSRFYISRFISNSSNVEYSIKLMKILGPPKVIEIDLSNNSFDEVPVDVSNNGDIILFHSNREGGYHVFTTTISGDVKQVSTGNTKSNFRGVAISPDSSKILYYDARDTTSNVYIYDIASGFSSLILSYFGPAVPTAFSPDGKDILFYTIRNGAQNIYMMGRDGLNISQLTNNTITEVTSKFHPDGKRVLFYRDPGDSKFQMYSIRTTASDEREISDGKGQDIPHDVSTEVQSRILFYSDRENRREIYTIFWDGTGLRRYTDNTHYDEPAAFSRDNLKILMRMIVGGNSQIFQIDKFSRFKQLTFSTTNDYPVKFFANGKKVLFYRGDSKRQIHVIDMTTIKD